ncbi:MAG: queuosine precursor transporter [Paraprevotella sp.]|nr:queuosine precursor transporter [Paraprevotella sp.]
MKEKTVSVTFMLLGIAFCVCLILANLLATKQFMFGSLNLTAGILVFPVSYVINDCIAEVWGFRKARLIIWCGFLMNFFFVLFGALADWIPGAPYWDNDEGFHRLFGLAPRVALGSFVAFLCGSFLNAYVMSVMKVASGGRHFSSRAIWSTVVGEAADSLLFFPIALGGLVPWSNLWLMMGCEVVLKTLYEVLVLPVTVRVVDYVKRTEGTDVYDRDISYNVLKISDL